MSINSCNSLSVVKWQRLIRQEDLARSLLPVTVRTDREGVLSVEQADLIEMQTFRSLSAA